jgi:O-antigen/teichoic acid export membrane protein
LVAVSFPWWRRSLDADWSLLVTIACGGLSLAVLIMVLGVLAAQERWRTAAALMLADAVVRLLATTLVTSINASLFWYSVAIVSGSLVWIPVVWSLRRTSFETLMHREPRLLVRAVAAVASTAGASLLIAGLPWLYAVTSGDAEKLGAGILAGLVLFRSPVLVLAHGFRPVVLRELVTPGADRVRHVRRAFIGYAMAAFVATAGASMLGPDVLRLTFGEDFVVTSIEAACLAVSAVLLALAAHLTVALVAIDLHRRGTEGWLVAVVATLAVLVLPIAGQERLLWAALAGPSAAIVYLSAAWARAVQRGEHDL